MFKRANVWVWAAIFALGLSGCGTQNTENQAAKEVFDHPEWSYNATIYELNTRQFTEEGTFAAAEKKLQELKELGIEIVWVMPIHPIGEKNRKGELGSYYAIKDYKGVNPEFGDLEDFKSFVNRAHELEMKVIIDWVANHTAWDHPWTETNPEYYNRDEDGNFQPPVEDWSDVIDLNYENPDVWAAMIDALEYWVREADIDGYRCDVASMVPTDFWNEARMRLDEIKPVFMLAEAEKPEHHNQAFDMSYAWSMHHVMNKVASDEMEVYHIDSTLRANRARFPEHAFRMQFTSNHDENSWNGTVFERLGDGAKTFAVLSATMEGMPLIYNGQEVGMDKRLEFFDKDPIEWKESDFRPFYTQLMHLKQDHPALRNGTRGEPMERISTSDTTSVYAFSRGEAGEKVVVFLNFSGEQVSFEAEHSTLSGTYERLFGGEEVTLEDMESLTLEPWEYRVLVAQ